MSARTVTEETLKCGCGLFPGITDKLAGRTHVYQVACSPCRAATGWSEDLADVVSHWNDAMRAHALVQAPFPPTGKEAGKDAGAPGNEPGF